MRLASCTVYGRSFDGPARGPMPACCSAECTQVHELAKRREWRAANPEKLAAQQARARAGRPMIFDVPCRVCGKPVAQVRKARGRHSRFCSPECWQEQHRRTNRKHKAKVRERGAGRKSGDLDPARPAPPSFADFISAPTNLEAPKVVATANDISQTLETQGVEKDGVSESREFFPISFIFEPQEPKP